MALLTPPPAAPQRGDSTTFANRVDAFITWLINFVSELVSLVANLNSIAAGGAYAIPYEYHSSGTFVGAGTGMLALINGGAYIELDTKGRNGSDVKALLAQFGASTSTVKGTVRMQSMTDPSKWMVHSVTSYALGGTGLYADIGVSFVSSSNGGQPFGEGEQIVLYFQRTGDKGDKGDNGTSLTPVFHAYDARANGVSGGVGVSGMNVRALNTVVRNTIGAGATLSSNRITLPAGTYRVEGNAPASGVGAHQAYLYNVTGSVILLSGGNEYEPGNTSRSMFRGEIVLATQTAMELRHFLGTNSGSLGAQVSSGQGEVYSEIFFEKIA